jgi:hypothetical protein
MILQPCPLCGSPSVAVDTGAACTDTAGAFCILAYDVQCECNRFVSVEEWQRTAGLVLAERDACAKIAADRYAELMQSSYRIGSLTPTPAAAEADYIAALIRGRDGK